MKLKTALAAGIAVLSMAVGSAALAEEKVEVLHWWTSGGEAKALNSLKELLSKEGVGWQDMPVAGGAGANAMTVLRARVTSGNPPTSVQLLGFDVQDWATEGVLADLTPIAEKNKWDEVVYPEQAHFAKHDGKWVSVPVNIHSSNWVWLSKAAMDKIGLANPPTSWDELIKALDLAKEKGIVPIAHGGQPWQDATVWENVVLTTGGVDFYKKALVDLDPEALGSDTMKTVFDRMTQLKGYFDPGSPGRDWNLSTAMVIKGDALLQVMGDWAKGEFVAAGKEPEKDFVCIRFPGTQGVVTFTGDHFAMFQTGDASSDAQVKLATAILDPSFQIAFNKIKGSIPARKDIDPKNFDSCGQKAIADMTEASASGKAPGSLAHGYAAPAAVKNAVFDVVTQQLNGQLSSQDATKALVTAVEAAK